MQDASGAAVSNQESQISNYLFTGRRKDAETGLYYYRNRYYSADLGRFLSTDPLDYVDGMNMYAYVVGNPVNFVDPWGLAVTEADKRKYCPWLAASADAKARGDNWTSVGLAIAGAGRAVVWDQWRFIFSEGGEAMHEVHVEQTLAYQNGELTAAEYSAYRIAKPFADFAMAPHMITGAVLTDPVATGKAVVTAPKTIAESFGTNAGEYFYGDGDLVSIFDTGEDALALLLLTRAGQVGITRSADVIRNVAPAVLRDGDVAISQALRTMPGGRMMNDAIYPNIVQDGLKGLGRNSGANSGIQLAKPKNWTPSEFEVVRHNQKIPGAKWTDYGFEKHHGVMDAWAKANIPGYTKGRAPTMVLSRSSHDATRRVFSDWYQSKGFSGEVPWKRISPKEAQKLSNAMFRAAGAPTSSVTNYFSEFHRYLYKFKKPQ